MKNALSFATVTLFVLSLAACTNNNDITGINVGKTPFASPPRPTPAASQAGPKIAVIAPNQPAPMPHKRGGTPTPTPTPTSTSSS